MIERLIRDESGMTMALAVIMVVLIGVMGAGLLTFVNSDLSTVIEVNQGQRALEVADAGVQAARRQLISNNATGKYDGGSDDLPWSYCYGMLGCSSSSPTSPGSSGMTVNVGADSASVTILQTGFSPAVYRVVSLGRVEEARRKVEAQFRITASVSAPKVYMTRTDLTLSGTGNPNGVSFFAMGNATRSGSFTLSGDDEVYGRWAETTGSGPPYPNSFGSYPNIYNPTPRGVSTAGIGALGSLLSGAPSPGSRSYGANTCPYAVRYYATSPKPAAAPAACTSRIAFPFRVLTDAEDQQELERLRQRAIALEKANPGASYYFDSNPGNNGGEDAGRSNGPFTITDWPSGADYDTVRYIKFQTYDSTNVVRYNPASAPCSNAAPRGVIVVENGNVTFDGNKGFNGGVVVRAYSSTGTSVANRGTFYGAGNSCLRGWANSSGAMTVEGTITLGDVPELGSTPSFKQVELLSWRELYE